MSSVRFSESHVCESSRSDVSFMAWRHQPRSTTSHDVGLSEFSEHRKGHRMQPLLLVDLSLGLAPIVKSERLQPLLLVALSLGLAPIVKGEGVCSLSSACRSLLCLSAYSENSGMLRPRS